MNFVSRWQSHEKIRNIEWKDLLFLKQREIVVEILISYPWLLAEIIFLSYGHIFPALLCSFFFFLTGLRQVHGGFHLSLGLNRKYTDWFLFLMSVLMLGAMHAVKFNHLRHHKHCMEDEDIEAKSAKMSAFAAIVFGPIFPFLLHREALLHGSSYYQKWILAELVANIVVIALAVLVLLTTGSAILLWHLALMAVGQCLTAFFAVWTVHHDCEGELFARTQRGWLKNFVSYDMFYHVEHHLFPRIPQKNLPIIAKRLDAALPELTQKRVY
jgi:fatty acid desaturase